MKVYVVADGCYSDYHIEAIFSTKETAEKYAALHGCDAVEEYECDPVKIEEDVQPWIVHIVERDLFGRLFVSETYYCDRELNTIRKWYDGFGVSVSLKSEDHEKAVKIAAERLAEYGYKMNTEGEG